MKETITNLHMIYNALDTISITGHSQSKTFTNCMDMLRYTLQELSKKQEEDENKTLAEKE